MKRIFCLLLAVIIAAGVTGCAETPANAGAAPQSPVSETTAAETVWETTEEDFPETAANVTETPAAETVWETTKEDFPETTANVTETTVGETALQTQELIKEPDDGYIIIQVPNTRTDAIPWNSLCTIYKDTHPEYTAEPYVDYRNVSVKVINDKVYFLYELKDELPDASLETWYFSDAYTGDIYDFDMNKISEGKTEDDSPGNYISVYVLPDVTSITVGMAENNVRKAYEDVHPEKTKAVGYEFFWNDIDVVENKFYYSISGCVPNKHFAGTFAWFYVDVYTGEAYWTREGELSPIADSW